MFSQASSPAFQPEGSVRPHHALAVSLWTGAAVLMLSGTMVAARVVTLPEPEPIAEEFSYQNPRAVFPDTTEVERERLVVMSPLPETKSEFRRVDYRFEPTPYADAEIVSAVETRYVESYPPPRGVVECDGVCVDASAVAQATVEDQAGDIAAARQASEQSPSQASNLASGVVIAGSAAVVTEAPEGTTDVIIVGADGLR